MQYKIVLLENYKYKSTYHTYKSSFAIKKYKQLIDENKDVLYYKKHVNRNHAIIPVNYKLALIRSGKTKPKYNITIEDYEILQVRDYRIPEHIYTFNHGKINLAEFLYRSEHQFTYLCGNKIIVGEQNPIIVNCKCSKDAIRLYNLLKNIDGYHLGAVHDKSALYDRLERLGYSRRKLFKQKTTN